VRLSSDATVARSTVAATQQRPVVAGNRRFGMIKATLSIHRPNRGAQWRRFRAALACLGMAFEGRDHARGRRQLCLAHLVTSGPHDEPVTALTFWGTLLPFPAPKELLADVGVPTCE